MKKSNFVALVLGTIGVVFFGLGMCMCMLPQWNLFRQGVLCGVIGLVVLLVAVLVWRRMEGRAPIKLSGKIVAALLVGILGVLALGVGMCMVMVFGNMVLGIALGLVGILVLIVPIPLARGIH